MQNICYIELLNGYHYTLDKNTHFMQMKTAHEEEEDSVGFKCIFEAKTTNKLNS